MEVLWLWLAMATLATFRLAEMVVNEEGPGAVFVRLRAATGMYDYDASGKPYQHANGIQRTLGGILSCVFCAGVWFAALATALLFVVYGLQLPIPFYIVFGMAAAGGQAILELWLQRHKG